MIYKIDKEMFQVELYHEGDKEPYDIIDIDEAINALRGIVYCKDCKYHEYENGRIPYCSLIGYRYGWDGYDYCSRGERSE